jgi:hypothetical protein
MKNPNTISISLEFSVTSKKKNPKKLISGKLENKQIKGQIVRTTFYKPISRIS